MTNKYKALLLNYEDENITQKNHLMCDHIFFLDISFYVLKSKPPL